jgi:diphosphoinositol-polyphosphate diphosphatase
MQGGWEDDETVEAAAQRETVEEAGVRGSIEVCGRLCCCGTRFQQH